ncbi:substrate-binding periplasmic protein [Maridesulfovibrio sp. FT414]|uniref:substrate-binding periplasmic protein n=1 Tax=Maridesulfovibrio sp. FT414 TaxID=2979469 RepID=UPI003D803014
MKKLLITLSCVLAILISSVAYAETITAAADPWVPFINPDSPTQGLSMEIVTAAFKTQGYDVKLEIVPWVRAENGVKEGSYDILPNTWMTDKRKAYLKYSAPYATNQIKFIKRKGDSFEYNGLSSLAGKTVGIVSGYGYSSDFMNDSGFVREPTTELITNIKKLIAERIDLAISDEIVAKATISQSNSAFLDKIEFTKNAMSQNDLHVTCGLANPRHSEIIDAFNKGLEAIKADGTYQQIMAKYGIK